MPTSLTAVGDLPLPNDYKISLRDQFTIILSGSKDAIFDLNVKLDGTILTNLGLFMLLEVLWEVREVKKMIEQSYIGVNIDVSLQNLSAKKITIVGLQKLLALIWLIHLVLLQALLDTLEAYLRLVH